LKSEIDLILKYIFLLFKNSILWIVLFLDLVGALVTYFTDYNVPNWILLSFPIVAILITGYNIFKNSAPKITVDKPKEDEFNIDFPYANTYNTINIKFDSYIRNFGLQSGALENIKINFLGVNEIKDEFILRHMDISFNEFLLCKEKNKFMILNIDPNNKYGFTFPMVLTPDTMIPIYFMVQMSFPGGEEVMEWVKRINFELEYKIRDGFGSEIKKIPFSIKVNNLIELKEEEIIDREAVERSFSGE
jgi:hypothetical protein